MGAGMSSIKGAAATAKIAAATNGRASCFCPQTATDSRPLLYQPEEAHPLLELVHAMGPLDVSLQTRTRSGTAAAVSKRCSTTCTPCNCRRLL